jgi:hypothetical protein
MKRTEILVTALDQLAYDTKFDATLFGPQCGLDCRGGPDIEDRVTDLS